MDLAKEKGFTIHNTHSINPSSTANIISLVTKDSLPTTADYSSDNGFDAEDDERPLTRAELASKTRRLNEISK